MRRWATHRSRTSTRAWSPKPPPPRGRSPEQVRAVVSRWIDRHPLPYLRACRYAGLGELFAGLRRHGKTIGVLSDYPATAKLAALELAADHIVTAHDAESAC